MNSASYELDRSGDQKPNAAMVRHVPDKPEMKGKVMWASSSSSSPSVDAGISPIIDQQTRLL